MTPLRSVLVAALVLAAVPRTWQMVADQGVFWPDEIFQTLEQAHRLAFGYGWTPWEFRDGARSWLFPGFLAGALKIGAAIGLIDSGVGVVMTARAIMLAFTLVGVYGCVRIGERLAGVYGALFAGTLCAFFPPLLVYGTRCMTETASGAVLVIAATLVMDRTERAAAIAGALAGLSIFLRYQNGLFAVVLLGMLLASPATRGAAKTHRPAVAYALAATAVGLSGGLLDWLTWGRPYHSFFFYVRFNLIEGKASQWGTAPWDHYLWTLWRSLGPAFSVIILGLALSFARARILPIACLVNLAIHCAIPHKELRFLMPMTPLALGLAGGGLGWAFEQLAGSHFARLARFARLAPIAAGALAMTLSVAFVRRALTMTFGEMGQNNGQREDGWSPWHAYSGVNRALWEAGKHADLCGVAIVGTPVIATGGYSYLHRNVPMLNDLRAEDLAAANYVIVPRQTLAMSGFTRVASYGFKVLFGPRTDGAKHGPVPDFDVLLLKRAGGCEPAPWWTPHFDARNASGEAEERIALDSILGPN